MFLLNKNLNPFSEIKNKLTSIFGHEVFKESLPEIEFNLIESELFGDKEIEYFLQFLYDEF